MSGLVQQISSALAGVALAVPDAVRQMTHADESGSAIKSSSVDLSGEAATESGAVEKARVIVTAADFPSLESDALVRLAGDPRIVTSLRTDPVGATLTVGLSDPLSAISAHWSGARRARSLSFPLDMIAELNGRATDPADAFAASDVYSWTIVVSASDWPDPQPPAIGDEVRFYKAGEIRLRVARVVARTGHFVINARSR